MRSSRVHVFGAVFTAVLLLQIIPAGFAAASEERPSDGVGITLLGEPGSRTDDPRARSYLIADAAPGSTVERRFAVVNDTDTPRLVHVYGGPAAITGGVFSVEGGASGAHDASVDISSWITVATGQIDLAAHSAGEIPVTVDVPSDAPEGEYYAAVWAEVREADVANGITLANRAGVRVYLTVGPGNGPPADFTIGPLSAILGDDGTRSVVAEVVNNGTRAVDLGGELSLENRSGSVSAGPFGSSMLTLAPGQTGSVDFSLDDAVVSGTWEAAVELRSGLVTRQAAGSVDVPAAATPSPVAQTTDGRGSAAVIAALVVALTLVIVVAVVLMVIAWRRRVTRILR